jgi:hypothetical protein
MIRFFEVYVQLPVCMFRRQMSVHHIAVSNCGSTVLHVMLFIQQNGDKFCWNKKCSASPVYSAYLKPVEGAVPPAQQLSNKCDSPSTTVITTTSVNTATATTADATIANGTTATTNGVSSSSDKTKSSAVEPDDDPMVIIDNDDSTDDVKKGATNDNGIGDASVRTYAAIALQLNAIAIVHHLTICQYQRSCINCLIYHLSTVRANYLYCCSLCYHQTITLLHMLQSKAGSSMDNSNNDDDANDDDTNALGYCNSFKRHTRINDIVTYALKAPVKVCYAMQYMYSAILCMLDTSCCKDFSAACVILISL